MMSETTASPRVWPVLLGAGICVILGAFLLLGGRPGQEPAAQPAPSSPSAVQSTPEQTTPTPTPGLTSAAPTSAADHQDTPASTPSTYLSEEPVSAERQSQQDVEQDAVDQAVGQLQGHELAAAEEIATRFVQAAYARAWDLDRAAWVAELEQTASPELVDQLDQDHDWESWHRDQFVQAQSRTSVRVNDAASQNAEGQRVEVLVSFTLSTHSDDPWLAAAPTLSSETLVIGLDAGEVVQRKSMEIAGGL